jgi:hypothetical protein
VIDFSNFSNSVPTFEMKSSRAEECLRRAAECQRRSVLATDRDFRQHYAELARLWQDLAQQAEALDEAGLASPGGNDASILAINSRLSSKASRLD